jgi:hypothetical protein
MNKSINFNQKNMENKTTRGGVRFGAGRKPTGMRKQPVTIYITPDIIAKIGKSEIRNRLNNYIKTIKDETIHN